jgi:hypothetical protein
MARKLSYEKDRIPVMRKKFSELGARKRKDIRNMMKKKVEEHWAKISASYPEELGKCMEDVNFVVVKSPLWPVAWEPTGLFCLRLLPK